jgi:hypothetical protein
MPEAVKETTALFSKNLFKSHAPSAKTQRRMRKN